VVRIPSSSRGSEGAAQDDNGDGRIDERDPSATETRAAAHQGTDTSTYRSASASPATPPAPPPAGYDRTVGTGPPAYPPTPAQPGAGTYRTGDPPTAAQPGAGTYPTGDPPAAPQPAAGTAAAGTAPAGTAAVDPSVGAHRGPAEDVTVVAGPRPRASLLATLSLIFGVAAALFVLTGTLAAYGIALGAVALLLSFAGMSATGRRHVAGKSDALVGLLLGLGAVGLGVLAVIGQFDWPNTDADTVQRFREWLDSQTVDRF
jgi:hypothetical protein